MNKSVLLIIGEAGSFGNAILKKSLVFVYAAPNLY